MPGTIEVYNNLLRGKVNLSYEEAICCDKFVVCRSLINNVSDAKVWDDSFRDEWGSLWDMEEESLSKWSRGLTGGESKVWDERLNWLMESFAWVVGLRN